jgi:hypothetical protein
MDPHRFDALTELIAGNRRGFLRGFGAVVASVLLLRGGDPAVARCRRVCHRRNGRTVCRRVCAPIVTPPCPGGQTDCPLYIPPKCSVVCRHVNRRRVCRRRCTQGINTFQCYDLQTDLANCGSCGTACPAGTTGCRSGRCCQLDDTPCPSSCAPGATCAGCCTGTCRFEGLCGALAACREAGEQCPGGCIGGQECRSCCQGYCGSGTRCCIPTDDPCPAGCDPAGSCTACCSGECAATGLCGQIG